MLKNRVIKGMLIGLAILAIVWIINYFRANEVQVGTVLRGEITEYIKIRGKVELDRKEKVCSKWPGVVGNVLVKEGSTVGPDTALLILEVLNPGNASSELEKARIAAKAALEDHSYQKEKLGKYRQLYRDGIVSEEVVKDQEMLVIAAERAQIEAEQQYKIVADNYLFTGKQETGAIKENNGLMRVYAGTKGRVLTKYIENGTQVVPGTPLFEIGDEDSDYYVRVDVLTDDAVKLKLGQRAVLTGKALDDMEVQGWVNFIAPKAETVLSSLGVEQQRVEVRIEYAYQKYPLKLGYGVDVKLITASEPNTLYAPEKAVFEKNGCDYVFAIKDNKLKLQPIRAGIENDDFIQIRGGLQEGDKIVADPDNSLKPGIKVKVGI